MKLSKLCILLMLIAVATIAVAQVPRSRHVWIIGEENHSYENVVASMPYLMSMANQYGLATQYYADIHNSLSALMHVTAGQTVTTNDSTTASFDVDNIVRQMLPLGLSFKSYQEQLPYAGFLGVSSGAYAKWHNPLLYFTDVAYTSLKYDSVPFTQLATDIAAHQTANLNYVTPDLLDDAHNGTMQQADYWLSRNLPAILALPEFQPGGDGLLFIVFDEGNLQTDNRCSATVSTGCGGRVATVVIGPRVKRGFRSSTWYNHESVLKTVCLAFGISNCPGAAQTAYAMRDFFVPAGVWVGAPTNGASTLSPVHFVALANGGSYRITCMRIYVDSQSAYTVYTSDINAYLAMTAGWHNVTVQAWNSAGQVFKTGMTLSVAPGTAAAGVTVKAPQSGATVGSPVYFGASARPPAGRTISAMRIYVDYQSAYTTAGGNLSTYLPLASGTHNVIVQAWDNAGAVYKSGGSINVN